MFIKAGPDEAVSFTDDTSPDTRNTKKRNVSIHAKVSRTTPLNWYYDLLFACRDIKGEMKSKDAVEAYKQLRRYEQVNLWDTLKEVQINITDPLPYQADVNNILKQALNRNDAVDLVRQRAIAKDPFAIDILEKLNNHTAERILLDAPSRTLSWSIYFSQRYAGGYSLRSYMGDIGVPGPPDHEIDLSRLKGSKPGSIVRAATEWTSKSASAFSDAIDACFTHPYLHHHPALNPVYRALRECHAFDRGNHKYIDLMEDERKEIAHEMSYHAYWQAVYPLTPYRGDVDSRESYFVQAADLAGGIAGYLYEHGGIFTVSLHFEYVMFNGKRISQNKAYEMMKKWQELGYYN